MFANLCCFCSTSQDIFLLKAIARCTEWIPPSCTLETSVRENSSESSFLIRLRSLPGGSNGKESACSVGDLCSIPGLERSLGGGHRIPLQYSCLENPHGHMHVRKGGLREPSELGSPVPWVTKSQIRLSDQAQQPVADRRQNWLPSGMLSTHAWNHLAEKSFMV